MQDSTLLVTVVTDAALHSSWVAQELNTYLEAAGRRLIVPILADSRDPESLRATTLERLADFQAAFETEENLASGVVSNTTVEAVRAQFQALKRRTILAVTAGVILIGLALAGGIERKRIADSRQHSARLQWQEKAAKFSGELRFDLAEWALAQAAAAEPDAEPELRVPYFKVRDHRVLVPAGVIAVSRSQRLLEFASHSRSPIPILYDHASGALEVLGTDGTVTKLPSCDSEPLHALGDSEFVWSCGSGIHRLDLDRGTLTAVEVPREPEELRVVGDELRLLERSPEGTVTLRRLAVSSLKELGSVVLSKAPAGGVTKLCPGREPLAFAVTAGNQGLVTYQWSTADGSGARSSWFAVQSAMGPDVPVRTVSGAWSTSTCGRLLVRYESELMVGSTLPPAHEWARLYISDQRAARSITDQVRSLLMLDDGSGSEAVFLSETGDVRSVRGPIRGLRSTAQDHRLRCEGVCSPLRSLTAHAPPIRGERARLARVRRRPRSREVSRCGSRAAEGRPLS